MSDTEHTAAPVEAIQTDTGPRSNAAEQADLNEGSPEAVAGEGQETDEQEEGEESEEETPAESEPPKKKRKGLQDRLDELTAEKYTHKTEREKAERERDDIRRQLEELKSQASQPAKVATDAPKTLEDFDYDHAAFTNYLTGEAVKKAMAEKETQERQSAKEREQQEKVRKFETGVAAAIAARPEVQSLIYNPLSKFYPEDLVEFIYDSDESVELGAYLGENPAETDGLLRMEPAARLRALARIEGKLSAPPAAQPKTFTQAPAPVKSLSGNAPVKKAMEEMSMDEYAAERKRQLAAKRR